MQKVLGKRAVNMENFLYSGQLNLFCLPATSLAPVGEKKMQEKEMGRTFCLQEWSCMWWLGGRNLT